MCRILLYFCRDCVYIPFPALPQWLQKVCHNVQALPPVGCLQPNPSPTPAERPPVGAREGRKAPQHARALWLTGGVIPVGNKPVFIFIDMFFQSRYFVWHREVILWLMFNKTSHWNGIFFTNMSLLPSFAWVSNFLPPKLIRPLRLTEDIFLHLAVLDLVRFFATAISWYLKAVWRLSVSGSVPSRPTDSHTCAVFLYFIALRFGHRRLPCFSPVVGFWLWYWIKRNGFVQKKSLQSTCDFFCDFVLRLEVASTIKLILLCQTDFRAIWWAQEQIFPRVPPNKKIPNQAG